MLKINKILSKKIKLTLSLRGAKRRSNLSGFSLIELMVAAAILAMAIFGIFHAYSAGFMGMADARDRTVATNYAREAMEDVKNMDFVKIRSTYKSVINANKKYKIYVNVSTETANLKEIYTIVEWEDRNGIKKTVESSTLVHFMEVFALDPAKIVLFTDSYAILNSGGTTVLTAVIKDIKGNTIIDWDEGDITFSILSGTEYGCLSSIGEEGEEYECLSSIAVTPDNGEAETTFSSDGGDLPEGGIGYTVIKASVNLPIIGIVSDQVTIKVTDGPVKIGLTANPGIIKASTTNCSTITVSLQNAAEITLKKNNLVSGVEITFKVVFGVSEGNLSTSTIIIQAGNGNGDDDAVGTIDLCSTGKPGLVIVFATATGLGSSRVDVKFLGPPVSILISANPNSMYVDDDGSEITVSLIDKNGFPTNPTGEDIDVTFLLSPNTNGELNPHFLTFIATDSEGISETTYFSGQTSAEAVTITASGGGLIEDSVTISIRPALVPDHIKLKARPPIVQAGSTSIIEATVYDNSGRIVSKYNGDITFTNTGVGDFIGGDSVTATNGVAEIELSYGSSGTASIDASLLYNSNLIESIKSVVVGFYGGAHHITLTADPKYVKLNGGNTSTITATVYDLNNIHVSNYSETIIFTNTGVGDFIGGNSVTANNGIATIGLYYSEVGIAIITASDEDGVISSNIKKVEFYNVTTIKLVDNIAIYYPEYLKVAFEVVAVGESILVEGMEISWDPNAATEKFQKIVIGSDEVYTGNSLSGAIVNIEDKILDNGELYLVELTFGKDVAEKMFVVTFYTSIGMFMLEGLNPIPQ